MNPCCHTTAETANSKSKRSPQIGFKMCVGSCRTAWLCYLWSYQGAKCSNATRATEKTWGLGKIIVLSLLDVLPQNICYIVFMDNFFTSLCLLKFLASNNI